MARFMREWHTSSSSLGEAPTRKGGGGGEYGCCWTVEKEEEGNGGGNRGRSSQGGRGRARGAPCTRLVFLNRLAAFLGLASLPSAVVPLTHLCLLPLASLPFSASLAYLVCLVWSALPALFALLPLTSLAFGLSVLCTWLSGLCPLPSALPPLAGFYRILFPPLLATPFRTVSLELYPGVPCGLGGVPGRRKPDMEPSVIVGGGEKPCSP